jgi:carboxymethylenebutenolidase
VEVVTGNSLRLITHFIIRGVVHLAAQNPSGETFIMLKTLSMAVVLLVTGFAIAAGPSTQPAALPPSGDDGLAVKALAASPRHGEWADVPIPGSDVKLHTWVVYPERHDKASIVIVIHEIFGMTDWVRSVTDQLAAEGYIAVAPDLLSGFGPDGGGTESLGNNVQAAFRKLTADEQTKRLDAVRGFALEFPSANDKVATIGFCWGGGASFSYATHQPALKAAIVCYGTPPAKSAMEKITCPVLGLYGGDDGRITATVDAATQSMAELKKTYEPHIFGGAGHGFMRQQSGRNGANLKAAQQGWDEAIRLLKLNVEEAK